MELEVRNDSLGPADAEDLDPDPSWGALSLGVGVEAEAEGPDLLFDVRVLFRSEPGWRVLFARAVAEDWMRVARDGVEAGDGDGDGAGAGSGLELWVLGFPRMFGFSDMLVWLGLESRRCSPGGVEMVHGSI